MINKERLYNRLLELGAIGKQEEGGITRHSFTAEDRAAKELVASFMNEAGLTVREDSVGNLIGRKEGRNPEAPVVLTGSHIDTVCNGGIFDGALGIIGGIEVLQTLNEQAIDVEHPIEVYAFNDEEGCRFSFSMFGSRGVIGDLQQKDLEMKDKDGVSVAEVMKAQGFDPDKVSEAIRTKESLKVFIELHIEQGKVLESNNLSVGIVSGIVNELWLKCTVTGEAGHAGATPMNLRNDALVAAAEMVQMIEREAKKNGTTVATVGRLKVLPGGINIIPGTVEFTLDLRDISQDVSDQVEKEIFKEFGRICEERGVELHTEILQRIPPAPCSEEFQRAAQGAFHQMGLKPFTLPSGAGHDAMQMINICPIGMIFVRSKNGISHNPAEWSSLEDCVDGVNVLYHNLLDLAVQV
ncbi:Zn-dependent hydrolase [Desulfosporosinus sp. BICA1-9]|uniref:Zn-dependent hydrolase n=1 Tax=Desulfosporosinus sp. BICA1-9 TaxID=1531958 RepID=UPI00054C0661|nr:Zn-dependent hydrolase [Desulfosporosinus sp. BICA1-9]KJS46145.1 MAG: allantoate amidohydrolase [Peptococcaceae bacterium BRH_c23]KJS85532.1 MAG: allantoate amidohydrolase [Desulfosporosinus sp. BICA1-9]HBW36875.1 Zn-dependent hydrolase [Desulfosporosinus sp.]